MPSTGKAHGLTKEWLERAREVLDIETDGIRAVREALDGRFLRALETLAACRGRVVVTGIGKSGLVGRKIAATLSSTGTPAYFLHPVEGAHGDLGVVREDDVVLAISNSGETDELNALVPALKRLGVGLVALTGDCASSLARLADVALSCAVPKEACHLGLAPTASTTAALALGDALALCLMRLKELDADDFKVLHPGGSLGRRLSMRVADLMQAHAPKAPLGSSLAEALEALNAGGLGAVLVTGRGSAVRRVKGIVTDGDVRRLVVARAYRPEAPVESFMTPDPATVRAAQSAAELLDLMEDKAITVAPVVDEEGELVGVIHLHDLLGKGRLRFSE